MNTKLDLPNKNFKQVKKGEIEKWGKTQKKKTRKIFFWWWWFHRIFVYKPFGHALKVNNKNRQVLGGLNLNPSTVNRADPDNVLKMRILLKHMVLNWRNFETLPMELGHNWQVTINLRFHCNQFNIFKVKWKWNWCTESNHNIKNAAQLIL